MICRVVDQYLSILIKLSKEAKPEFNEELFKRERLSKKLLSATNEK